MNAFNFGWLIKRAVNPQEALNKMRVQQVKADRPAAMQRQGLNANNPADLAKFRGGTTGPMAPSTPMSPPQQPPKPQSTISSTNFSPPQPKSPPQPAQPPRPRPVSRPAQTQARPATFTPPQPSVSPGASAWANQTNNQPGAISAPLSSTSTVFNNATGQQDPPHIITTDNGRKFNTQTKTFLDGRPGGFAR